MNFDVWCVKQGIIFLGCYSSKEFSESGTPDKEKKKIQINHTKKPTKTMKQWLEHKFLKLKMSAVHDSFWDSFIFFFYFFSFYLFPFYPSPPPPPLLSLFFLFLLYLFSFYPFFHQFFLSSPPIFLPSFPPFPWCFPSFLPFSFIPFSLSLFPSLFSLPLPTPLFLHFFLLSPAPPPSPHFRFFPSYYSPGGGGGGNANHYKQANNGLDRARFIGKHNGTLNCPLTSIPPLR